MFPSVMLIVGQVHRFVMLATKAVVPDSFWGCRSNWKLVEQRASFGLLIYILLTPHADVKTLIDCRRFETLTLHRVVQGFQTSMCEWLMPPGTQDGQNRVSVSDALKRRELLEDFLYWYFGSFVLSILKVGFQHMKPIKALRSIFIDIILRDGLIGFQIPHLVFPTR